MVEYISGSVHSCRLSNYIARLSSSVPNNLASHFVITTYIMATKENCGRSWSWYSWVDQQTRGIARPRPLRTRCTSDRATVRCEGRTRCARQERNENHRCRPNKVQWMQRSPSFRRNWHATHISGRRNLTVVNGGKAQTRWPWPCPSCWWGPNDGRGWQLHGEVSSWQSRQQRRSRIECWTQFLFG